MGSLLETIGCNRRQFNESRRLQAITAPIPEPAQNTCFLQKSRPGVVVELLGGADVAEQHL